MDFASVANLKVQAARAAKPKPPPGAEARLQRAWDDLDRQERALKLEQKYLSEIWLTVCDKHKENAAAREALEGAKKAAGVGAFVDPTTPVTLNVGGQLFETTAGVLCRDEYSILAGLCRGEGGVRTGASSSEEGAAAEGLLLPDPAGSPTEGALFLDRDWWIFRHVLQFLRTGALPEDPALVEELYGEATFYRLGLLRQAIEKRHEAYQRRALKEATTTHAHHHHHHRLGPSYYDHRRGLYETAVAAGGCGCGGGCAGCSSGHGHTGTGLFQDRPHGRTALPDPFGFSADFAPRTMR